MKEIEQKNKSHTLDCFLIIILKVPTNNNVSRLCEFQENIHTPPCPKRRVQGSQGGTRESKFLTESTNQNWNFQRDWGRVGWIKLKTLQRIWIFLGITDGFFTLSTSTCNILCDTTQVTISAVVGRFPLMTCCIKSSRFTCMSTKHKRPVRHMT